MGLSRHSRTLLVLPLVGTLAFGAAPAAAQDAAGNRAASPDPASRSLGLPRAAARFDQTPDQTSAPLPQDPTVTRSFWTKRHIALVSGASAAAFSGFMAIWQERNLRGQKAEIQALPPGAVEEWTRLHEQAEGVMKDRNFWGAAAVGLAGVTILYAVSPNFYEISFPRPGRGGPAKSVVRFRPFGLGAAASWVF